MGLTRAELEFYERIPNILKSIANELAEQNKLLKEQNELLKAGKGE